MDSLDLLIAIINIQNDLLGLIVDMFSFTLESTICEGRYIGCLLHSYSTGTWLIALNFSDRGIHQDSVLNLLMDLKQWSQNFFQCFLPRAMCGKIHKQLGHSLEVKYVLPYLVYLSKLNLFLEFAAGQLTMDCGPQLARGPQF
ncbi:hypothetical protein mRhiFer1_008022 [Rhinolophus ferrumequinum]|uniref:Uncharacterized protein n=1 Tax=Rhinolophus ferrumequinum TaxID=59479 RepID=A0A7J7WQR1_RHIFE|nr:hypothetical protein mRhiFer1_008022 [Rhinolophus ferrumequinum]